MQIFFWILAIVFSFAMGYWVLRADKKRAIPYPWLTASLRSLVIFLTCLLLLAPYLQVAKNEVEKPIILFLQDNSQSVPLALKKDTASYKKDAQTLIDQLSKSYKVVKWGFGNTIQNDTLFHYTQSATDISNALSQAMAFYGQQNLGAIILASDGRFNQGLNPEFQDLPYQGSVYTVALGDSNIQKDIRIAQVYANKTVSLNNQFEIRADIVAQMCNGYNNNIQLKDAESNTTLNTAISISSNKYDRAISFTVKADKPGLHHYIITAPADANEQNVANNRKDVFVDVVNEQKNILIAANAPHPDISAIREALDGLEGYHVVVKTADQLPTNFDDYQIVILHSLPSQTNVVKQLMNSKKAVWFIMGANSNNALMNQYQTIAKLNVNPFNLQNLFAVYNSSFTTFTLPSNINAVMDKMPPLAVPAGMIEAGPQAQVLCYAKGNPKMPLWMLQQGTTPSAILVGEGIWRWRLFEYRYFNSHQVIDEMIRQTISFLSANANEKPFSVELPKFIWNDQEAITMNAYLLNANNEQVNNVDAQITITDSLGKKQDYTFEKSGNAYKLNIGLRAGGTYHYVATTSYGGKNYSNAGSFVVQHTAIEMMETGADYPLLHSIANKYNGALVPASEVSSLYDSIKNNKNIKPVIQSSHDTIPLVDWKWYFFLILFFATAEWLLRKFWLAQ